MKKKIFYCWVKPIHYSEFYTRHPCTTLGLQITQNIGSHDASATSLHSTTSLQQVYPPKEWTFQTAHSMAGHPPSHLTPHTSQRSRLGFARLARMARMARMAITNINRFQWWDTTLHRQGSQSYTKPFTNIPNKKTTTIENG